MATGSVPLLEAVQCGTNTLKKGVIEVIIQESPLMEMLPWETFAGNALEHSVELTLPSPQFRDVNATYDRSHGTDTKHFWGVSILGGEVFTDNYLIRVAANRESIVAKQYKKFAKAMSRTFDKTFFDGTGASSDFKGVNSLIAEGFGLRYYVGTSSGNGAALALDDLDIAFDSIRGQAGVSAILANRTHRRKITKLGRTSVTGVSLIDVGSDSFGRQIFHYNDTPIRIIGDDITQTAILGFDETQGNVSTTSSLYLVSFGDEDVTGLLGAGGSWDVNDFGETEAAPGNLGRVECYPGVGIFNQYSIVRVSGILDA